jgi:hypothetical protein
MKGIDVPTEIGAGGAVTTGCSCPMATVAAGADGDCTVRTGKIGLTVGVEIVPRANETMGEGSTLMGDSRVTGEGIATGASVATGEGIAIGASVVTGDGLATGSSGATGEGIATGASVATGDGVAIGASVATAIGFTDATGKTGFVF